MYQSFASIYDDFMTDIPYDSWYTFITDVWKKYAHTPTVVLDLGCGTGNFTKKISAIYPTIGIDLSLDMLMMARGKDENSTYIQQDMRYFSLPEKVDTIVSICDSMNYLLTQKDFLSTLSSAYQALEDKGLFVFDLLTEKAYKSYGNSVFVDQLPHASYIWENHYDEENKINEYELTLFIRKNGLYEKTTEWHEEKAYAMEKVVSLAKEVGFSILACYDNASFQMADENSMRIHYVLQKEAT